MTHAVDNTRRAFTLIELILVMTIMALIGVFAAMMIFNAQEHVKRTETKATMDLIVTAISQYKEDIGHYPLGDGSTLVTILTDPAGGWADAGWHWFPKREELKDAWGMEFQYRGHEHYDLGKDVGEARGVERTPNRGDFYNSSTYQLYSYGPNMRTWAEKLPNAQSRLCGTEEDDIRNWEHEEFYTDARYVTGG